MTPLHTQILTARDRNGQELRTIQNQLQKLPPGKLICSRNGTTVKWYQGDGHSKTYIPKANRTLAEQLALKKYLQQQEQILLIRTRKTNRKNAGFTDEERAKMTVLLSAGFTDTFRHFYPDTEGIYSWWSYRFHAREKNAGWRIDYFITSSALDDRLVDAGILTDVTGSDHCPVTLTVDLPFCP